MPSKLSSLNKQNLLLEFASLQHACPEGVFVTITPGNPTLWAGVLFARKGPYMPSILRFQISFPAQFPSQPPLVTFSSEIFHPLLTPLSTYTYTTSATDTETVSASDQERLPPGGFSLRHGFPQWFKQARESSGAKSPTGLITGSSAASTVTVYEILEYLKLAFNEESFLDSIPLEAAANPGAYHAWNAHQARKSSRAVSPQSGPSSKRSSGIENMSGTLSGDNESAAATNRGRKPGQWNWEGVWEDRVKRGIQSTVAEQVLFGSSSAADELIRFSSLDPDQLGAILQEMGKDRAI
ncbi:hypothetical protein BT63DRAFT_449671 [Microthyrium microscopicum]|uniref:UBC core domain-containing protein n=1 Tax=Microthyrium microscopicum TaxID=703497 RepID=A0A6A6UQZ6_9PEZI|nr:hypothetical protein BT63DRAFT_449671 [Microthyrium microscopicum]